MTLTIFGVVVLTFMMLMYALERNGPGFILAFALGCGLSSAFGIFSGAWPFGCVEAIWTVIATHRYRETTHLGTSRYNFAPGHLPRASAEVLASESTRLIRVTG